tara:strand:- start:765 stop:1100 length:336 start_codon:yes stop_codon:yes gene_type:complete
MPKYTGRDIIINDDDSYKNLLDERGVKDIEHYTTIFFNNSFSRARYDAIEYVWKKGDKLHKISSLLYGTLEYWWIIALWNMKPTDAHFKQGDVIEIPTDPEQVYSDLVSTL